MNKEQDKENIEEIKKVIVENIEIAIEDICSIKKFTELEEDNIKTILEWLIRIQLEEVEKEIDKLKEAIERVRLDVDVIICDCGEKYKDSDLDLSVGDLEKTFKEIKEAIKKIKR